MPGYKYWPPGGTGTAVQHTGSHKKVTAYGAIADAIKRFFRTYAAGFNTETLIRSATEMKRRFGKMAIIPDGAPPPAPGT